ncbi:MAG: glycosyltransferase [Planctomycetaceae bacterium]|jgi:glycosyltransferase involved in cell wall biosynthesis|nr:glycosyltransferase [Planctomycetaceae bacterium]
MNILYLHLGITGRWARTFYMARGLARAGHNVTLLTAMNKPHGLKLWHTSIIDNVRIVEFYEPLPKKFLSKGFGFISVIMKCVYALYHQYELVVCDGGTRSAGIVCRFYRYTHNTIYISEWWDFLGKDGYLDNKSLIYKILYGWWENYIEIRDKQVADGVVVLSNFMRQRAIEHNIDDKKIEIIQGGTMQELIDMSLISTNHSTLNLGYIGMNNRECSLLENFLYAITDEKFHGKVKFHTYGSYLDKNIIEKYGLKDVIVEHGWVNLSSVVDIIKLKDIDVFVQFLPDNNMAKAGFPNKLGEYISLGRAVILAPYGDLWQFIHDREGFFVIERDIESIKEKISEILAMDRKKLACMGKSSREYAKMLTWENKAKQMLLFYQRILSKDNVFRE